MFNPVFRRLCRPIAFTLIAAQLLLSAPMVNALANVLAESAGSAMPCADSMGAKQQHPDCPCCPDGVLSMAGCLTTCAATAAIASPSVSIEISTGQIEVRAVVVPHLAQLADPPLKPPPIV